MSGLLDLLAASLPPEGRAALYGYTPGGAATVNPRMLVGSAPLSGLAQLLPAHSDSAIPNRYVMRVPGQPMGNRGIHAWPFPGANLPNAYRGPLTPGGKPGFQNAPERYVPGLEDYWLRGI